MKMINDILVVINNFNLRRKDKNQENMIRQSFAFAKQQNADLKFMLVIEEKTYDFSLLPSPFNIDSDEFTKLLIKAAQTEIKKTLSRYHNKYAFKTTVITGIPFLAIIQDVLKQKHDLVIISDNRKKRRLNDSFDVNIFRLLRKCPCPVWVVGPKSSRHKGVVVAIDLDTQDKTKEDLNFKLVEIAKIFSRFYKTSLHILSAWEFAGEITLRRSPFLKIKPQAINKLVSRYRITQEQAMLSFIRKLDLKGIKYDYHSIKGQPDQVIAKFVKRNKAMLLTIGTVCRTGLPGFIIGNTAEHVIREVNCPIVAIKPDGFVSPVKLGKG